MSGIAATLGLIDAVDEHLAHLDGEGIDAVREKLHVAMRDPRTRRSQPPAPPACGWLSQCLELASAQGLARIAEAIARAEPELAWRTYDGYPSGAAGPRFPRAHAFVDLVGQDAPVVAEDFDLGLFLIAPRTFYRDHRHKAPELYAALTGPTRWRFNGGVWLTRQAGEFVWNESMHIHATLVEECPFLCIYAWTQDVSIPAEIVPAPDWHAIESGCE
jgi:hypothetical protein